MKQINNMKNCIIVFLFLIFMLVESKAQNIFTGDVTLETQDEVVAFGANNYTEITGNLEIQEGASGSITDLTPLLSLTSIGGILKLGSSGITNLNGLNSITTIGGDLSVSNTRNITNIDEFSKLNSVGNSIVFESNSALTNVDGFNGIQEVKGSLYIQRCNELTNIGGLINITSIAGDLHLFQLRNLTNYDGFMNLTSVGGSLDIQRQELLNNIDGFKNLTSIGGYFTFRINPFITNLDGLSKVLSILGNLNVSTNAALNSFCGLFTVLNGGGLAGTYSVISNLTNPTMEEIIADGACLPTSINNGLSEIPQNFILAQNYPNPFNPTTTIKYSLPFVGTENIKSVKLIVYDILGKEVVTLVNEQKAAGNYKVEFDASRLSSGIYFYIIRSGKFIETKKMLLMK